MEKISTGIVLFLLVASIIVYLWLHVLVAEAAKKRGRSGGGWVVLALFISPLGAWIILLCLGDTDEKRRQKIIEEEEWRQNIARRHVNDVFQPSFTQKLPQITNPSGKTINDLYKKN